jgi:autotransporter-associated beta strand protein
MTSTFRPLLSAPSSRIKMPKRIALCLCVAVALVTANSSRAADQTWTGTTSSSWATGTNWSGGAMPGTTSTSATTKNANRDIATIVTTSPFRNPIGIPGTTLALGEIDFQGSTDQLIGASGTTGSDLILQLNGGGTSNVILHDSGSATLTLQANNGQATPNTLVLFLGNTTNNIVNIDGSGGINIGVSITGSGKNLTLNGNGAGILTFSGGAANTYSGTTTVNVGELDLQKTTGLDAVAGNLTIGDGVGAANTATVKLLNADQIANSSDVTINSDGVLDLNGKNETIDGLNSSLSTASVTLGSGTLTVGSNNETSASFAGVITGAGGSLIKTGSGTQAITGANSFTGSTTVSGGTLTVGVGSLVSTSSVKVNSGGTLLLSGNGRHIGANTPVTLNGGTFNTGGFSEPTATHDATPASYIGTLTLQSSSILDLASGASIIAFTNSSGQTWTGTLSIYNWTGTQITGNGLDQVYFGTDITGLTVQQLNAINFYSDSGSTFLGTANWGTDLDGEIVPTLVPVPEPSTWIGAALAVGAIAFTQRRKLRR